MDPVPHQFMSVIPLCSEPGPHSSPSGVCSFLWSEESHSDGDRTQSSCLLSTFSESLDLLSGRFCVCVQKPEVNFQAPYTLFYETGSLTGTRGFQLG